MKILYLATYVCKYQKTVADELKGDSFTKEDMLRIYRDMEYIREFESMLKLSLIHI